MRSLFAIATHQNTSSLELDQGMNSTTRLCILILSASTLAPDRATSAPVAADPPAQVYVSSMGRDTRNGTRLKPKRTFQAAVDAVAADGQIIALDSADYGPIVIGKSVTIAANPGVIATVSASADQAILVGPGTRVTLRGLQIKSAVPGLTAGIHANSPTALRIEQCAISGFGSGASMNTSAGLLIAIAEAPAGIVVSDTVITDCPGTAVSHGVVGSSGSSNSNLVMERCRILSNGQGVLAGSVGRVTVRDSVISNNAGAGIGGGGFGQNTVRLHAEHCAVTGNGIGIAAFDSASVVVSNTSITGNAVGVTGFPMTFGNNQLLNNATDGSFGAVVPQK